MFRPNPAIIRFTSKRYQIFLATSCYKSLIPFGCKPDDGRIRPKHVVIFSSSINIVRNTCCVIDCTHIPVTNFDTYNPLVVAIFTERLEVSQQAAQKFDVVWLLTFYSAEINFPPL